MDEEQRAIRILVVDDNAIMRRLTGQILAGAGYQVSEAATGAEGLACAQTQQPDLVLLDLMLPDLGGIEVCRRLKADPATARIHVLVITAFDADAIYRIAVLEADADGYVLRPIPNRELIARIEALLRLKRVEDDLRATNERLRLELAERTRIEASLREREQSLAKARQFAEGLIVAMQDGFSVLDPQGVHIDVNPAFCRMTGFARAELIGVGPPHPYWPPEGLPEIEQAFARTLRGEAGNFELTFMRKNGERFPVIVCPANIRDAQGQIVSYFATVKDITERKRAEDILRQTARDLQRSNQDLESFAYVASHDLQEPLRMVTMYLQLLAQRYAGQLDADADEFIAFAVDGAKRMQKLINDLLDYSRIATRGQPPKPTAAEAALDDALWNLGQTIADAGAVVTHDPLPVVLADPIQLMQLFQNLIGNAIKFRGEQPPAVHIAARPAPAADQGAIWEFSVRDNGIGIDPQDHERIFGVFQRLHTQQEYPGTGIGLAICRRIVERHGGRIWIESQPGAGATFYFTLPAG